jgi:hypothetical protein
MKLVLCPYGHKNEPGVRFCTTCKLPIPPDPTSVDVDEDVDDDPDPIPVVPGPSPPKKREPPPEPPIDPTPQPEPPTPPPLPDGKYCPNGHWNPPDQERWCRECAEPLWEEDEKDHAEDPGPPWSRIAIAAGVGALVVGIVLVILAWGDDEVVPGEAADTTTTTTTTQPPVPVTLPVEAITVTVSSEQPDGENFAVNVLDGQRDTAWGHCGAGCPPDADPAADASGVGAFIQFDFDQPYTVVSFSIINGYDKVVEDGSDRWEQNSRIASMTVTADGGQTRTVSLADVRTVQQVDLDFEEPTTFIRFTVEAVNPGSRWEDVTISEVRFDVLEPEE